MSVVVSIDPLSNEGDISFTNLYSEEIGEMKDITSLPEEYKAYIPEKDVANVRSGIQDFPTRGLGFDICSTLAQDLLGCNALTQFEIGNVHPGVLFYGMACDDMRVNDKSLFTVDVDSTQFLAYFYTNGQAYPNLSNLQLCKHVGDIQTDIRSVKELEISDFQAQYRNILISSGLLSPQDVIHMYMETAYMSSIEHSQEFYSSLLSSNAALPTRGVLYNIRRSMKIYNVYKGDDENCGCKGCNSTSNSNSVNDDGYIGYIHGSMSDRQYSNYRTHHACPPFQSASRGNHAHKHIDSTQPVLLSGVQYDGNPNTAYNIKDSQHWLGKISTSIPGEFPFPSTLTPTEHVFRSIARRHVFQSLAKHVAPGQLKQLTLVQAVDGVFRFYHQQQQGLVFEQIQQVQVPSLVPFDIRKVYPNHTEAINTNTLPASDFAECINAYFTPLHPLYPYVSAGLLLPYARCIHAFPHGLFDLFTDHADEDEDIDGENDSSMKEVFGVGSLLCTMGVSFTELGLPVIEPIPIEYLTNSWNQICFLNPLFKNSTVNVNNAVTVILSPGTTLRLRMGATRGVRGEEWVVAQNCTDSIVSSIATATQPSSRAVSKYILAQLSTPVLLLHAVQQQLKYLYYLLQEDAVIRGQGHTRDRVPVQTDQTLLRLVRKHMSKVHDSKIIGISGNVYHDYVLIGLERQYGGKDELQDSSTTNYTRSKNVITDAWILVRQDEETALKAIDALPVPELHVSQTELTIEQVQRLGLDYIDLHGEWKDMGIVHGALIPPSSSNVTMPLDMMKDVLENTSKPATRNSTHPRGEKVDQHQHASGTTSTNTNNHTKELTSTHVIKEEPTPQVIVTTADAGLSSGTLQHQHAGLANSGLSALALSHELLPKEQQCSFGDMLFLPVVFNRTNHVFHSNTNNKRKANHQVKEETRASDKELANAMFNVEGSIPAATPVPAMHLRRYMYPAPQDEKLVLPGDKSLERVSKLISTLDVIGNAPLPATEPLPSLVANAAAAVEASNMNTTGNQALLNIPLDYYPQAPSSMKIPSMSTMTTLHPPISAPQIPPLQNTPCACHIYNPTHLPFSVLNTNVLVKQFHRACAWMRANHIPCDHRAIAVMLVHNLPPPGLKPSKADIVVVRPELLIEDLDTLKPLSATAPRHDELCPINIRCPAYLISASNNTDVHQERGLSNYYKALGMADTYRSQLDTIHSATLTARERYWMGEKYNTTTSIPQYNADLILNMVKEHGYSVYSGQREMAEEQDARDYDAVKTSPIEHISKYYNLLQNMQERKEMNVAKKQRLTSNADAMLLARTVSLNQHACDTTIHDVEYLEEDAVLTTNTAPNVQKNQKIWPNSEYNHEEHFKPPMIIEAIHTNPPDLSAIHPLSYVAPKMQQQQADGSMSQKKLHLPVNKKVYTGTGKMYAREIVPKVSPPHRVTTRVKAEQQSTREEEDDDEDEEEDEQSQQEQMEQPHTKTNHCNDMKMDDSIEPPSTPVPTPVLEEDGTLVSKFNDWRCNLLAETAALGVAIQSKSNSMTCFYGPHQSRVGDQYQAAHLPPLQTGAQRIREAVNRAEAITGSTRHTAILPSIPPFSVYSYVQCGSMWMVRNTLPAQKEAHHHHTSSQQCLSDTEATQLIDKVRNALVYAWVCQQGSTIAWCHANEKVCNCEFSWFPQQDSIDPTSSSSILRNAWWLQPKHLSCSHLIEKKGKQDKNNSTNVDASGSDQLYSLNRCVQEYIQRVAQTGADIEYITNSNNSSQNNNTTMHSTNSRNRKSNAPVASTAPNTSTVSANVQEQEEAITQRDNRKKDRDQAKKEPTAPVAVAASASKSGITLTKELQQLLGPEDEKEPSAGLNLLGRLQFRVNKIAKRLHNISTNMYNMGGSITNFAYQGLPLADISEEQDQQASDNVQIMVRFLQESGRADILPAPLSLAAQSPTVWAIREIDEHMTTGLGQYLFRDTDDIILNEALVTIRAKRSRRAYMRAIERVLRQAACRFAGVAYAIEQAQTDFTIDSINANLHDNPLISPYTERSTTWSPNSLEDVSFSTSYIQIFPQVVSILSSMDVTTAEYVNKTFHTWDFTTPANHKVAMNKEGVDSLFHKSLLHSLKILLRQQTSLANADNMNLGYLAPQHYASGTKQGKLVKEEVTPFVTVVDSKNDDRMVDKDTVEKDAVDTVVASKEEENMAENMISDNTPPTDVDVRMRDEAVITSMQEEHELIVNTDHSAEQNVFTDKDIVLNEDTTTDSSTNTSENVNISVDTEVDAHIHSNHTNVSQIDGIQSEQAIIEMIDEISTSHSDIPITSNINMDNTLLSNDMHVLVKEEVPLMEKSILLSTPLEHPASPQSENILPIIKNDTIAAVFDTCTLMDPVAIQNITVEEVEHVEMLQNPVDNVITDSIVPVVEEENVNIPPKEGENTCLVNTDTINVEQTSHSIVNNDTVMMHSEDIITYYDPSTENTPISTNNCNTDTTNNAFDIPALETSLMEKDVVCTDMTPASDSILVTSMNKDTLVSDVQSTEASPCVLIKEEAEQHGITMMNDSIQHQSIKIEDENMNNIENTPYNTPYNNTLVHHNTTDQCNVIADDVHSVTIDSLDMSMENNVLMSVDTENLTTENNDTNDNPINITLPSVQSSANIGLDHLIASAPVFDHLSSINSTTSEPILYTAEIQQTDTLHPVSILSSTENTNITIDEETMHDIE